MVCGLVRSRVANAPQGRGASNRLRVAEEPASWNKLIVAAADLAPAVVSHYVARTGVSSQQTNQPTPADRPSNLFEPVHYVDDHGARGRFGDRARGVLDLQLLRSLPTMARKVTAALGAQGARRWPA